MDRAIALGQGTGSGPSQLSRALEYAVKPGGARIRPTIALSVAMACGDDRPKLTDAAISALELIHCASLVHDDMPCFDDADVRRGKPSVHKAFSEPLALLTGDSLIVLAFEVLARAGAEKPDRLAELIRILAARTGMPGGICAGQGWESEKTIDLGAYHRAKTGALFIAATQMGAVAAGQDADPWEELGARIGEAFQVADDLRDALLDEAALGKPAGQDAVHDRPNAVNILGVRGAVSRLQDILSGAIASIPSCPGEAMLAQMVRAYADRIVPEPARIYAAE
ncbi:MAG: polyprenyl synthetase family protein [Oceanicola sp.]|nr:polyprenyl synthetase family protein [Oceanicola sp.]